MSHVKETVEIDATIVFPTRLGLLGHILYKIYCKLFAVEIAYQGVDGRHFQKVHRFVVEVCEDSEWF